MPLFTNPKKKSVVFIASNREVRAVPFTWQHPVDATGEPIPLRTRDYRYTENEIAELVAEGHTREELDAEFMPDFSAVPAEQMGVAVYETTTEGTPLTPVFPNTREGLFQLLQYCAQHCATFADIQTGLDGWARILGLQLLPCRFRRQIWRSEPRLPAERPTGVKPSGCYGQARACYVLSMRSGRACCSIKQAKATKCRPASVASRRS
ncbi:MAG TPA: hypothetical protein VKQ30_25870 [Ktedonobacterales bacterium]|nr:hypothetical protein [Ktedonobacterales bacterium]